MDATIQTFELSTLNDIHSHLHNHPIPPRTRDNISKEQRKALDALNNRDDLIITRADKGGAIVIWGIQEYLKEADSHLLNTEFYEELTHDPFMEYQEHITNSLDKLYSDKLIDKKTATALKPVNTKPARFYLLPKIHKPNHPGRPVISSTNCHTTKLSKFVDHYIQPHAKQLKSYIRDTTEFLNKISNLHTTIPPGAILVTMDVKSLYTNIKHNEGLAALKMCLDNSTNTYPSTDVILTLMNLILTLNCFNFNGKSYLQIKGCAMGTVSAPSYANIFMGHFEETYIYPLITEDCLYYARYIDDIFFIYTGSQAKLDTFITHLNTLHNSIKFDLCSSTHSIAFLDTLVYIDNNRKLQTTLYTKPTDTHSYLHFHSAHPRHLKINLPFSQALRIRRICSEDNELTKNMNNLITNFTMRGYKQQKVKELTLKAMSIPRENTLKLTCKPPSDRIPLITTFNNSLPPLANIIKKRWDMLKLKPHLETLFKEPGLICFRRPPNTRDIIGSNLIIDNKVIQKRPPTHTIHFCQPCNKKGSRCCTQVLSTNFFKSTITSKTYNIFHNSNCKDKNIIYLLTCKLCDKQYVGKSETQFNLRLNLYRNRIYSARHNSLTPVEKHFKELGHDFNRDATFVIIERIEHNSPEKIPTIIKKHEDAWVLRLHTLLPNGLNVRLNNPINPSTS